MKSSATSGSISILLFLGLAHFFNDVFQSILSASYPVLADGLHLSFGQIGVISLVYQIFASVFQPLFGVLFDRHQSPWYLPLSTISTMTGLLLLAFATSMDSLLFAVAFMGLGSSMTHPEASRLTHVASEE